MPTRKVKDLPSAWDRPCASPGHNPPRHMVFPPGEYEHECPRLWNEAAFCG